MRITYILLLISLICLATAKYLPDESTSKALLRHKRSSQEDADNTLENQSNESDDEDSSELTENQKLQLKYAKEQLKLQEKREKEERKKAEELEKEHKKREKLEIKMREEKLKLEEKLEKEERKRQEKLAKEELKKAEKIAKEEQKRQEKMRKQIEKLEKKTIKSENKSENSSESGEDLDFEDIWKNYIYQKYGLTTSSTDLEKDATVARYIQEELGLNANSTKTEYRQAVLQLVNNKLLGGNSSTGFQNYFVSHVNAVYIQKLQADIENKISELDNDTALLQNVTLPWAPVAKQAIGEEKSILTSIAQFLSNVVPSWITGEKPATNASIPSSSSTDSLSSADSNVSSSNGEIASNSNDNLASISNPNIAGQVGGTDVINESESSTKPVVSGISVNDGSSSNMDSSNVNVVSSPNNSTPSTATNSNTDTPASSSNVALNENSAINELSPVDGSIVNNNGGSVAGASPVLNPSTSNIDNDIPSSSAVGNNSPAPGGPNVNSAANVPSASEVVSSSNIDQSNSSTDHINSPAITGITLDPSPVVPEVSITMDADSISGQATPGVDSTSSVLNENTPQAGASIVSSSSSDVNDNMDQSTGSTVINSDSGIPSSDSTIPDELSQANSPATNSSPDQASSIADSASGVLDAVTSPASSNSNIGNSASPSDVIINENSLNGQSTVDNNNAAVNVDSISNPNIPLTSDSSSSSQIISSSTQAITVSEAVEGSSNPTVSETSADSSSSQAVSSSSQSIAVSNVVDATSNPTVSEIPTDSSSSQVISSSSQPSAVSNAVDAASNPAVPETTAVSSSNQAQSGSSNPIAVSNALNTASNPSVPETSADSSSSQTTSSSSQLSEVSNGVDPSSVLPSNVEINSPNGSTVLDENAQSSGSSISTSAPPNGEASTTINSISSAIEGSASNSQVPVSTDNNVALNGDTTVVPVNIASTSAVDQPKDVEVNGAVSSTTSISGLDTTSTGEHIADTGSFSPTSSSDVVNDLTSETTFENSLISTAESTVAIASGDVDSIVGSTGAPISAVEVIPVQNTAEQNEVTNIQASEVTNSIDENTNSAVPTQSDLVGNNDNTIVSSSTNESLTPEVVSVTTIAPAFTSPPISQSISQENISEVPVIIQEVTNISETSSSAVNVVTESSASSVGTDITVEAAAIDASISTIDIVPPTQAAASTDAANEPIGQEVITVAPVVEVSNTPDQQNTISTISVIEAASPQAINDESNVTNDVAVNEELSVSTQEEIASTLVQISTSTSLPSSQVTVADTIASEPPVSDATADLPSSTINTEVTDEASTTVSLNNTTTVAPNLAGSSVAEETHVTAEPETPTASSVNSESFTSVNEVTVSNIDVSSVPASEYVGTDSSLLSTIDEIITTEAPQAAQNTNTPTVPEELGASLLEVTQQ